MEAKTFPGQTFARLFLLLCVPLSVALSRYLVWRHSHLEVLSMVGIAYLVFVAIGVSLVVVVGIVALGMAVVRFLTGKPLR
jgi:hypothetical protein